MRLFAALFLICTLALAQTTTQTAPPKAGGDQYQRWRTPPTGKVSGQTTSAYTRVGNGTFAQPTFGGDLTGTSTTQTVIGLLGHPLPALTGGGYIHWTGTAWVLDTPTGGGGSMTWPSVPGIAVCTGTPCNAWTLSFSPSNLIPANYISVLNQNTTGNAATASALSSTPTLCTVGQAPIGILPNGNATGCAPSGMTWPPSLGIASYSGSSSWSTSYNASNPIPATFIANPLTQNTTGNAGTATQLSGTPTLCSTGNAPTGILANGNATGCAPLGSGGGGSGTVSSGTANQFAFYAATGTTVSGNTNLTDVSSTLSYGGSGGMVAQSISISSPFQVYTTYPAVAFSAVTGNAGLGVSNDGNWYLSNNGGTPSRVATLADIGGGGGSMTYPSGTGIAVVTAGASWGTTLPTSSTGVAQSNGSSWSVATVPNSLLANSGTTINGQSCVLGATCAVESATAGQLAVSGGSGSALTGASTLTYSGSTLSTTSGGILDLSAATGTAAFKVPTSASVSADGALSFDSTAGFGNYHVSSNGADSIIAIFSASLGNGLIPQVFNNGSQLKLTSSGIQAGNLVTASAAAGAANQVAISAGANKALGYVAVGTTNQVLLGNTGAAPSFGSLPAAAVPATLSSTTSVNGTTIPASATLATLIAAGTAAMGTSAIASGACATVVTDGTVTAGAVANVATTDIIVYTPNADPTAVTGYAVSASGSLYIWAYPTAGHVNFKVCNNTSASLTPAALTLNWRVAR